MCYLAKIIRYLFCWIFFLKLGFAACIVTDDAGKKIFFKNPPQRIISLAPDITEILYALNVGDHIVGTVKHSDFPPDAKKIPWVGNAFTINVEAIIKLKPDLIIIWGRTYLPLLKKLPFPIYVNDPHNLEDIVYSISRLACLMPPQKIKTNLPALFKETLHSIKKTYATKKPVTVFFALWPEPLITISKKSWINDVIELCGGENIFKALSPIAPIVNVEAVLLQDPEVIIISSQNAAWKKWEKWHTMRAVKNHHLYTIHPDNIERAGPRLLRGAISICNMLDQARHH